MKKALLGTLALAILTGCSQQATEETTPNQKTPLSVEATVLMQFLEAYEDISRALTVNSACEVLPEPVSNRFEGYVSALNVKLHRSEEISETVLEGYHAQWRDAATKRSGRDPDCDERARTLVDNAMALAQTLYRQIQ